VALLGDLHPLGIIIPSVLFASLLVGAQSMQVQIGLSASFVTAVQALIVLSVVGAKVFNQYRLEWREAPDSELALPPRTPDARAPTSGGEQTES
jgi:simple sugar transport system permease protein